MKPFFFLLFLIASGILFATLSRPFTLVTEAARSLGRLPDWLKTKGQVASVALPPAGRADTSRKQSVSADSWQSAAQF